MKKLKNKISVAKQPDHLELSVVPQSNFIQRVGKLFRKEPTVLGDNNWFHFYTHSPETRIGLYQHRLELIRTIATSINVLATICVLLKVFKVL